ncbi:MAG: YajQ family cyclic di-GMP-binding protein [Candidatus Omnitrophica bacterium]|nr:YajQ family cyclic di-GMP-binding protein [Candidatus Omnitrophota bacterium]
MAAEHSFDVVSKVNLQEVRNAIQQAQKEIATRFDFRGSSASVAFEESPAVLKVTGDHQVQLRSVVEVVEGKLGKRGVSLKAFAWSPPEQLPGGSVKQQATLQQGLSSEKAHEITKAIKELGIKVQARIDGDAVRVASKQIDALQAVIQGLKQRDFGLPIQVENYR